MHCVIGNGPCQTTMISTTTMLHGEIMSEVSKRTNGSNSAAGTARDVIRTNIWSLSSSEINGNNLGLISRKQIKNKGAEGANKESAISPICALRRFTCLGYANLQQRQRGSEGGIGAILLALGNLKHLKFPQTYTSFPGTGETVTFRARDGEAELTGTYSQRVTGSPVRKAHRR